MLEEDKSQTEEPESSPFQMVLYEGVTFEKIQIFSDEKPKDGYEFIAFVLIGIEYEISEYENVCRRIFEDATHFWTSGPAYYFYRKR